MWVVAFLLGLTVGGGATYAWLRRGAAEPQPERPEAAVAESEDSTDQLTELATLTGGLAHEIRNPLSTLKVNLQLLGEDWREAAEDEDTDLRRRSIHKIQSLRTEVDRLQEILDDFLHYIGRQELHRAPVDLNDLVDDLLVFFRPQAESKSVRIRASLDPQPLICDVDRGKLKQAVLNLLVNAQQAMPEGGDLIVRTAAQEDGMARIEVADTGPGIREEDKEKIFLPYFSTKGEGTGLGLPTTRRIVRGHGGTIDLHTEPNNGTSFTIRLPLSSDVPRSDRIIDHPGEGPA